MSSFPKKFDCKSKIVSISPLEKRHLRMAKEFSLFINRLIREDAKILMWTKKTAEDELEWFKNIIKKVADRKSVYLVVEFRNKPVALTSMSLGIERSSHLANLGISIAKEFRGCGLGKFLMQEIVFLAKKELKPKPQIIQLYVFENNFPAMNLYKKMGFKKVSFTPNVVQYRGKLIGEYTMHLQVK